MPETSMQTQWQNTIKEVSDEDIKKFAGFISAGISMWISAGEMLVQMKEKDPAILDKINAKHPGISREILRRFEDIGNKRIYPYLLLDNCPGSKRLLAMPYSTQENLYRAQIDLVIALKKGEPVTVKRRIQELTTFEIDRVFCEERVRTVPEQVEFLKNALAPMPRKPRNEAAPKSEIVCKFCGDENCSRCKNNTAIAELLAALKVAVKKLSSAVDEDEPEVRRLRSVLTRYE